MTTEREAGGKAPEDRGEDPGVFEWQQEFAGPVRLCVHQNAPGPIGVEGWDRNEVHVRAVKHLRAGAGGNARRLLDEAEVKVNVEGERVLVETFVPEPLLSWGCSPRASVEISVRVPVGSETDIDSGSGTVTVRNTMGPVTVDSGSGSVAVSRAAGTVGVDSGSGSVSVEEVKGSVNLDIGSGSIRIARVEGGIEVDGSSGSVGARDIVGRVSVDTASGSVALTRVSGDILVDTGSGGVKLQQVKSKNITVDTGSGSIGAEFDVVPDGRYRFETGSGRVDLTVPDGSSFTFEAETGSGRINCLVPIKTSRSSRHHLQGTVGDGAARVEADTSSGSVTLRACPADGSARDSSGPCGSGSTGREYREAVLKMVQDGKVSAEQADELLAALGASGDDAGAKPDDDTAAKPAG